MRLSRHVAACTASRNILQVQDKRQTRLGKMGLADFRAMRQIARLFRHFMPLPRHGTRHQNLRPEDRRRAGRGAGRRREPCRLHLLREEPALHRAGRSRAAAQGGAAARRKAVAVTVDADDATLDEIVDGMSPDMLQLHGKETPERVAAVKARYGLPVMKAFSVREARRSRRDRRPIVGVADRFLFDAKPPAGSELPGGNGVSVRLAAAGRASTPASTTCFRAASTPPISARPCGSPIRPGIDISSGVESAPGVKDVGADRRIFPGRAGRAGEPRRLRPWAVYFLPRKGLSLAGRSRTKATVPQACGQDHEQAG